ncbi:3-methyl-2-oxobutanoate hydroxymethyltransferase [Candidatus Desantisbacteria bacterium CG2_30_40_21]|uniref:3-methyl-2-oxobutanoate hydroxymethyltransferase n=5 Tax=unclassified Candidatus Desantisiibacteriota TaxID=3106372 RepID=A0A2M7JCT4_9BACT|nr:MAG: 3-methyl-2-oxobutanoate hydroxymethyltransferase [Candidatus Desantisbacteria bacterium CG2_30_40_21]PIP41253.1 MAG: 3-methyl-2-oxobutanoate hydroxymethyltransferase [Candidatus Desantisbacteria bacterium CG23_combo_of_CG06-09_8_20_14_all_40_23]PIX17194.1 MAG: 3-methyl-2-oxobutanoate hydroxymethyltransferase [Candidatus Desantisbacteria bacterium CG_4_8_14_3_um_filter_40_12]PIY18706.1 MAG: 3-methyl-2-oxobutanoate hydroxymethyltransferase [Candidatus Desantisbacteria bacterium CG_4_10_14_
MITTTNLLQMKKSGQKITMLTAYDYSVASILDEAKVDVLLVGDSLGMVMLGYKDTLPVTMDEMVHHTKAVVRACNHALIVADMPFLSYKVDIRDAVYNAGRLIKEGGAQGVKVEGGAEIVDVVTAIIKADIPVMGHIGLTPQAIHQMGGYKVQGKDSKAAQKIFYDAQCLADTGVFAIVMECIPWKLAEEITHTLPNTPTIGIGAGTHCDGQVLVTHDLLGLYNRKIPKFVRKYADLTSVITIAVENFSKDVREQKFPALQESFE